MREIKFRAWDVENNKMIQSYAHVSKYGQFYTTWTSTDSEREYIPMQYTGLKDKNGGKEIFEGDVVRIEDYYENVRIGIIAFDSGTYKLQNLGQNFYYQFGSDGEYDWESIENVDEDNIEILGNIYENPELLDNK